MSAVTGNNRFHGCQQVVRIAPRCGLPPLLSGVLKLDHDVSAELTQQMSLVLVIDVEGGAGGAGCGRQAIHAQIGERIALTQQLFGAGQKSALPLAASIASTPLSGAGY